MPPGHPIILLKSNSFNIAAVSVKRSIIDMAFTYGRRLLTMTPTRLVSSSFSENEDSGGVPRLAGS